MALHFTLCVNHQPIGLFVAQRREPVVPEDGVCTYDVEVDASSPGHGRTFRTLVLRHRYDGCVAGGGGRATIGRSRFSGRTCSVTTRR